MLINFLHIYGSAIYPSVHAICPLGGLENLWAWVAGKSNLQKLFSGTMILFFFTLAFTLIFGRAFCGNICPFGGLQELLGKISKRKFAFPQKIDRILRLTKYLLLILVTIMAWITASIWISPYDPYAAFSHIWEGSELFVEMGIGFAILIIVLGASIFIDRFFCKYLCPAGALYGFISKISPTKIKRNTECSSCGLCSRACPMNINVDNVAAVKSAECIACGQCVSACLSKNNAIQMTIFGKAVKPLVFVIATVVIFFTSIAAFDRAGLFQVTIPSLTSVTESGNHLNIADLRGSMSIETGAEYTGMELSEFYKTMEIPQTVPKETLFKDVPSYVPGYDFHVIKVK
jgi:polyferredoxin